MNRTMGRLGLPAAILCATGAVTSGNLLAVPSASAYASNEGSTKVSISQTVEAALDAEVAALGVPASRKSDGSFAAKAGVARISIPEDSAGGVVATIRTGSKTAVSIGVGTGSGTAADGELAQDGSVVYDESGSTDRVVQATKEGFSISTVIHDANAQTEFAHDLTLPSGARLVLANDRQTDGGQTGGVPAGEGLPNDEPCGALIIGQDGKLLGGFAAPWARDANGAEVPTHFEVRSSQLVQVVEHRNPTVAYPVVADPYFGIPLINGATWQWTEGWTLRVSPTWWARANAGSYLVGVYGWDELYSKMWYRGLNTNLDGMRDQYICHQHVVALVQPWKATWNLDEWRPDVSYWETVNSSCNPGGPRWFD